MTQELLAAVILCLYAPAQATTGAIVNAAIAGFGWGLGNRQVQPELPHWAVRLQRSHANLIENLASFLSLVVIAHLLQVSNPWTVGAAWTFVTCRLLFAPVYALGITVLRLRTLLYFVSVGALAVLAGQILTAAGGRLS
jgi:uncharacterized MAPEG superfamily protein